MLKKLLKHEIYATGRIILPIYGIAIILSLVNRILININLDNIPFKIISTLTMVTYVISIIAIMFITFILIILRFYKNLMTDEGYLMFTLPVKPIHLVNSKLLSSILWLIASIIMISLSLFILLANPERMVALRDLWNMLFRELKSVAGDKYSILLVEFFIMIIIGVIQQILLIYVSIAVGHLFTGHKVLGSFASYIAINTIFQIITTLVFLATAFFSRTSIERLENLPQITFLLVIILAVIYNILFYAATIYIFNRKLNLE